MSSKQCSKYCIVCGKPTLHESYRFSDGLGCLITLITGGLFLPLWLLLAAVNSIFPKWTCQSCGAKNK